MKIMLSANISGAGKDSVADYLVKHYGFLKLSFASYIYEIAQDLFDMKTKDRKLLQSIGQSLRKIDPDVWANRTFKTGEYVSNELYQNVVISDLRQENEYNIGVSLGYIPIRIVSTVENAVLRMQKRDGSVDTSLLMTEGETGTLDKEMTSITNDGTLDELYSKVDKLMSELRLHDR